MIAFKDWKLTQEGPLPVMQYDHLSCRLQVRGAMPEGYAWAMLVKAGDAMNIIAMEPDEGGLSALLTAEELSLRGYYQMQLRGTRGEEVRHTNVIRVFVEGSLSGDVQWPVLPTEFTQMEQAILAAAKRAEEAAARTPQIREGSWWVYDPAVGDYVDTGVRVQVDVDLATPDWQQNDESAGDYVKNRTHYEFMEEILVPLELQWDGDSEGKESVVLPVEELDFQLVKVTDVTPTAADLSGSTIRICSAMEGETMVEEIPVGEMLEVQDLAAMGLPMAMAILEGMPMILSVREACSFMGCDFTAGLWVFRILQEGMEMYLAGLTTANAIVPGQRLAVKKLDNRYLEPFVLKKIPPRVICRETVMLFAAKRLTLPWNTEVTEGETYIVCYNGTDYSVPCETMTLDGQQGFALGNRKLAGGEDNGLPFLVVSLPESGQTAFYVSSIETLMHSFGIRTAAGEAYRMENRYLDLDRAWMPEQVVEEKEITGDVSVFAGKSTMGKAFKTTAFAWGNRYVVTWNGVEYNCIAKGVVLGSGLTDLVIGNVPVAYSNTEIPDTGEPFCLSLGVNAQTGEIGNVLLYATEDAVFSVRGEVSRWNTLPYYAAPAPYTIPTDLAAGKDGGGEAAAPAYEEMRQAELALQAGAKVYGFWRGAAVEVLRVSPDGKNNRHTVVYRTEDGSVYTADCYTAAEPVTPAVQREDLILLDGNEAKYRVYAQAGGALCVEGADGAVSYQIPRVEHGGLILESSTAGSSKRFRLTVNDAGVLSAVEMTE